MSCTVKPEEITRVKGLGFLHNKGTDMFNGRVITGNGVITADQTAAIAEAAKKYGNGQVCFTTRMTVECQGIPFDNIEDFRKEIEKAGLETGGTGKKVRPVMACKGTTCQYGRIDTYKVAQDIHDRFYTGYREVAFPHKFKIAVGGCPNNCVKPDLNDVGIMGQYMPEFDPEKCRNCGVCQVEKNCPIGAARLKEGLFVYDNEACNGCGRCVGKCPFGSFDRGTYGYRVYIGGRWGKKVARGRMIDHFFTSQEEVMDFVEKAMLLFREQGISGERFAETIERLGFENVQSQLLGNELLERKEIILNSPLHEKK